LKKEAKEREREELWQRIANAKDAYLEHCRAFDIDPRTGMHIKLRSVDGEVVDGPWDTAS
jgi:hypothetical protein